MCLDKMISKGVPCRAQPDIHRNHFWFNVGHSHTISTMLNWNQQRGL